MGLTACDMAQTEKLVREQVWSAEGGSFFGQVGSERLQFLVGKFYFLTPNTWTKIYLQFLMSRCSEGFTFGSALNRLGLIFGVSSNVRGQLIIYIYNINDELVRLTSKTPLLNVWVGR